MKNIISYNRVDGKLFKTVYTDGFSFLNFIFVLLYIQASGTAWASSQLRWSSSSSSPPCYSSFDSLWRQAKKCLPMMAFWILSDTQTITRSKCRSGKTILETQLNIVIVLLISWVYILQKDHRDYSSIPEKPERTGQREVSRTVITKSVQLVKCFLLALQRFQMYGMPHFSLMSYPVIMTCIHIPRSGHVFSACTVFIKYIQFKLIITQRLQKKLVSSCFITTLKIYSFPHGWSLLNFRKRFKT